MISLVSRSFQEAHLELQSKAFTTKLQQFTENENISISTSPVILAADFLQTAGKAALLHQVKPIFSRLIISTDSTFVLQSEELDDELRLSLKNYRLSRQSTVENIVKNLVTLCQYLPTDYIQSSFLMKLKTHLNELCKNFTTEK